MIARRVFNIPTMGWQNPFAELDRIQRQMNQLTNAFMGGPGVRFTPSRVFPAINITEDNSNYYLRAELPGIKAEELNLEVNGRSLSISGERKIKTEGEHVKYHRKERESGKFSRVIELPKDIDAERVQARMVDGILTVKVAKAEKAKPRVITVE